MDSSTHRQATPPHPMDGSPHTPSSTSRAPSPVTPVRHSSRPWQCDDLSQWRQPRSLHAHRPGSLSPPPAPRALARTYRTGSHERRMEGIQSVARKLDFDEPQSDPRGMSGLSRRGRAGDYDLGLTSKKLASPLLSFARPVDERSETERMACKMLGSPIELHSHGNHQHPECKTAPPSPTHSFRDAFVQPATLRSSRKRSYSEATAAFSSARDPTSLSATGASPKRQQPKRSCTMKRMPLVVQRSMYPQGPSFSGPRSSMPRARRQSRKTSAVTSHLTLDLHRTESCSGIAKMAQSSYVPLRPVAWRKRLFVPGADMGRSISYASYLAQTPAEWKPPKVVVAAQQAWSHTRHASYHSSPPYSPFSPSSLTNSEEADIFCPFTSSSPSSTYAVSLDYFGNWSASASTLAEAR